MPNERHSVYASKRKKFLLALLLTAPTWAYPYDGTVYGVYPEGVLLDRGGALEGLAEPGQRGIGMTDELRSAPDYDFPAEDPDAKELAAQLRPGNLVMNLKVVAEPVIEIFRDQLVPLQKEANPYLVLFLSRGGKYRYYSIPFSVVAPLLAWVRLSAEKRPRWHLTLVPKRNVLVARNGARVETVNLLPYYNRRPVK